MKTAPAPREGAAPRWCLCLLFVDRAERLGGTRRRRRVAPLLLALDDDVQLLVRGEARSRRDQAAHDDVLLQAAEVVLLAANRSFGEHLRRLLEGGRADERLGREARLRDAEEQGLRDRRATAALDDALVLPLEDVL